MLTSCFCCPQVAKAIIISTLNQNQTNSVLFLTKYNIQHFTPAAIDDVKSSIM